MKYKRIFDFTLSVIGLFLVWWLIFIAWVLATIDTKSNGFFMQQRVGENGKLFKVVKIKTMRPIEGQVSTITKDGDPRITRLGRFFRKTKIDELPQLINVFLGQMSFVGPRPDVPGYADKLQGRDRRVLSLKPGITGPATLAYRDEEEILAAQADPIKFNDEVIYPDKVKINLKYIDEWSIWLDIKYIIKTFFKK